MTNATSDLARSRVEAFLAGVERTSVDDLIVIALPMPDPTSRGERIALATKIATHAGRAALLAEARTRARALLVAGFARRAYDPTWFGLNWGRSLGRARDRVALVAAAEDAAAGAVVEDLIDATLVDDLAGPFTFAAGMRGSAPAANPILRRSRVGVAGRLAMLVVIALTFSWGLVGELLAVLLAFQTRPHGIELFGF